jgi:hypothetical protein
MALAAATVGSCLVGGRLGPMATCALAAGLVLAWLAGRRGAQAMAMPTTPAVLFFLGIAALALGASPLAPGGVHPLWTLAGGRGAAAIDLQEDWLGFLHLLGLGLIFWLACQSGARHGSARNVIAAMMGVGLAVEAVALLTGGPGRLWSIPASFRGLPLARDAGLRGAIFGVLLILAAEGIVQARLSAAAGGLLGRLRAAPLSLITAFFSAACLLLITTPGAAVIGVILVILQGCWSLLLAGGRRSTPYGVLVWLASGMGALAAAIAVLVTLGMPQDPAALLAMGGHWTAFWASPWMGYGLGSQAEVARLFMTPLNLSAVAAFETPPQSYLAWLEQGGFLGALPFLAAVVWTTVMIFLASVRQRRLSGVMRAVVCASLYLAVLGLTSSGPARFSAEAILITLLGLGVGAARAV